MPTSIFFKLLGLIAGCAFEAMAASARAPPPRASEIDVRGGALSAALAELAREQRIDLLFDERQASGLRTRPVRGRMTVDEALRRLLAESGIAFRKTRDGVYVLYRRSFPRPAEAPAPTSDGAISEILVVGRRTQNADIRRTENDIQPYHVTTSREIAASHRDGVDDLLRSLETRNAQMGSAGQDPFGRSGSYQSEVNLRGLGSAQTLILVDGRRMPATPTVFNILQQPDVNAIPLGAIERIEILPSTAGGIHGPGATGGVINIVLRRDYRGAELNIVTGMTERGDAPRLRAEGRIGFTPDNGRTDVMLFASHVIYGSLLTGDRDFLEQSRLRALSNSPAAYLARHPAGQGINIFSNGGDLVLDPAFGGAPLHSTFTSLPLNFAGNPMERAATLSANAGRINTAPPGDTTGARSDLLARPRLTSGLLTIRHRFGGLLEGFVDALYLRNNGKTVGRTTRTAVSLAADAPGNPFSQPIILTYPLPAISARSGTEVTTLRVAAGLIGSLPHDWRANIDYSYAETILNVVSNTALPTSDFYTALGSGLPGVDGKPALDPLGDWSAFIRALPSYLQTQQLRLHRVNRLSEGTLRLAGPVLTLAGGPLTLAVQAGVRREMIPRSTTNFQIGGTTFNSFAASYGQRDRYAYAELRAPLVEADSSIPLLSRLEVQLAARFDAQTMIVPTNLGRFEPTDATTAFKQNAAVYTFGLRFFPEPWVMVRGSIATGRLPPAFDQIGYSQATVGGYDAFGIGDPRRGGRLIGTEGTLTYLSGGSPTLRSERARSISIGVVLNPEGQGAPRLSIDATRIDKRDEVSAVYSNVPGYFIANEAAYPDRVLRAPPTAEDAALGFTTGRIILIDTRSFNSGRTVVQAVDLQLDWQFSIAGGADFSARGRLTWQPTLRRRKAPDLPSAALVNYGDGPLSLRANAGLDWTRGPLSIGVSAQYFSAYRVANSTFNATARNPQVVLYQGARDIPAQLYFDLVASRRFTVAGGAWPVRTIEVGLGIVNVLDHMPPIFANPDSAGYSHYGDPRGRRFELAVSAGF